MKKLLKAISCGTLAAMAGVFFVGGIAVLNGGR